MNNTNNKLNVLNFQLDFEGCFYYLPFELEKSGWLHCFNIFLILRANLKHKQKRCLLLCDITMHPEI